MAQRCRERAPSTTSETEEGKKERKESRASSEFEAWYTAYPRKKSRKAAESAYRKVIDSGEISAADLLARTVAYAASVKDTPPDQRRYIPHPASWLNSGGYLDEPEPLSATNAGTSKIEAPTLDPRTFSDARWRDCLAHYREKGTWAADYWGPAPGESGCLVPAELIETQVTLPSAQCQVDGERPSA
jgi:hypothetical protein